MSQPPQIAITGASGYVGRQLMSAVNWERATWLGRKEMPNPGYARIEQYDDSNLAPHLQEADVVIHLAAVVRGRVAGEIAAANVELVRDLAAMIEQYNPRARLIFLSTDLATSQYSLYGRSKRRAEGLIDEISSDAVSVRASMIVGRKRCDQSSTFDALARYSRLKLLPLPGGGRFAVRPLWIGDIVDILDKLIDNRGREADRGVWSMYGEPIRLVDLMRKLAVSNNHKPHFLPFPMWCATCPGRLLQRIRPRTQVPIDFLVAVGEGGGDNREAPDLFRHLEKDRTGIDRILELV